MKNIKGVSLAIISSATFGFLPLFCIPLLKSGINLDSICFYRFLFALILVAPILINNKISFKLSFRQYITLLFVSLFYAATGVFLTGSYAYVQSGIATTIHFLYPVLVAILMTLFFREKLSVFKFVSIIFAIIGVFYLCGGLDAFILQGGINLKGLGMVLITIVTYGLYIIGVNKIPILQKLNGFKLTFYVLLNSALLFFIYILAKGGDFSPIQTSSQWTNILFIAIVATFISNLSLVYAIKTIGSTTTAILGCMEPLTAVLIGYFVFGEMLGYNQMFGFVLIIISVLLVILSQSKIKI